MSSEAGHIKTMEGKNSNIKNGNNKRAMKKAGKIYFVRLNASERVQHIIFVACFVVLVITGFMGKTPEELVRVIGTAGEKIFFLRGILHRTAATVFIMAGLYFMLFRPTGRRRLTSILPKPGDFKDLDAKYLYFLGIKDKPPRFNRFSYMNRFKHMAFISVSIMMSVSGVIMWTGDRWSKFFLDVAIIVHSMQAILTCLVIALNVIGRTLTEKQKYPLNPESARRF